MPIRYVVSQGECFSSIARAFGFGNWRVLYDDPSNSDLKQRRSNPNALLPGDVVTIPDKVPKPNSIATGARHQFTLKRETPQLRLKLIGPDGKAISDRPFTLKLAGTERQGTTGDDGLIEEPVPMGTKVATLTVHIDEGDAPYDMVFTLRLGALDPVEEVSGVQARLANLGFDPGPIDGVWGDRTRAAVIAFQHANALELNGELDDNTKKALAHIYEGTR